SGAAGGAVDRLQAAQHRGAQVGVRRAGLLGADLLLQIQVEFAIDAGDADAGADRTGVRLDLVDGLADVARRVGIGDVRRRQRQPKLVGAQPRHGNREGLTETHDKLLASIPYRISPSMCATYRNTFSRS